MIMTTMMVTLMTLMIFDVVDSFVIVIDFIIITKI